MKKKNLFKYISIFILLSCTSKEPNFNNTTIYFTNKEHDFGIVLLKKEISHIFEFENTGKELLQIKNVKTSCGCTVPEWTKKTLKPKEKGSIKVTYDSKYPGKFNKTVTVFYNGRNSPLELKIKGEVN